jgi:hypothetical protein
MAEVAVQPAVVAVWLAVEGDRDFRLAENLAETLRLGPRIGVAGEVEDEERWDPFAPRHVGDGGEVGVFLRVVAELLAVAERGNLAGNCSLP